MNFKAATLLLSLFSVASVFGLEEAIAEADGLVPRYNRVSTSNHHHHHHHHKPCPKPCPKPEPSSETTCPPPPPPKPHCRRKPSCSSSSSSETTCPPPPPPKPHCRRRRSCSSSSSSSSSCKDMPQCNPYYTTNNRYGGCSVPARRRCSSSSSRSHHWPKPCGPKECNWDEVSAKVLSQTQTLQAYLSTCPVTQPYPFQIAAIVSPFANVASIGKDCPSGGCCFQYTPLTSYIATYFQTAYCVPVPALPVHFYAQIPPTPVKASNGTVIVTSVQVVGSVTPNVKQVRYFWKKKSDCNYWLDYMELQDSACPSSGVQLCSAVTCT